MSISIPPPEKGELWREQRYVDALYAHLDALRAETVALLAGALAEPGTGTHQGDSERDSLTAHYQSRIAQIDAVDSGLCFGRLDRTGGDRTYIGRIGLLDDENDYQPLLVDWRAPASRPFYCATAVNPESVVRRRHFRTSGRRLVDFDDELFDLAAAGNGDSRLIGESRLSGETALLAALAARRTGRMGDIVATIQAEQDRIIRSDLTGVLVLQGGPGTGKTAVALHRAAYLLYTHRQQLARRGVLIVGPSPTFLRYIDQVLPSLGETGVLLRTVGQLYPGVEATGDEPAEAAAIKGRAEFADIIDAAVLDRQRLPRTALTVPFDGATLRIDRRACESARRRAWETRLPHNLARRAFRDELLDTLARLVIAKYEYGLPASDVAAEQAAVRAELAEEDAVEAAVDDLWPSLTPQQLLTGLYAEPDRLAAAAPQLTSAERALLHRQPGAPWTPADVPLLDEAAELLGVDDAEERARAAAARRSELDFADDVLEALDHEEDADPDVLHPRDVLKATHLAERHEHRLDLTAVERAAADRTWTFGHIIVDEAQELSHMAWRAILRRCPSRSITIVGDVAQTGSAAGASRWADALDPHLGSNWRLAELTVNYRTPTEIMTVAADVLAAVDPDLAPPASVRSTGVAPAAHRFACPDTLAAGLVGLVTAEAREVAGGRLAVLTPSRRFAELARQVTDAIPHAAAGGAPGALDCSVVVLTVGQAKGLEFDAVVVVEPAELLAESARGGSDLYVALTRTTRRLAVAYTGELPAVLARLTSCPQPPTSTMGSASHRSRPTTSGRGRPSS